MNHQQSVLTSKEAVITFKRRIDETLRVIGFLNNTDKQNVLKYWETVSSDIQSALNGERHLVSHSGRRGLERILQNASNGSITIGVPLSCSDKRKKRLRVLGIVNKQVTDDYVEVSDESECGPGQSNLSIQDSSGLRSVPADLITRISQLGDYVNDLEVYDGKIDNSNTNVNYSSYRSPFFSTNVEAPPSMLLPKAEEVGLRAEFENQCQVKELDSIDNPVSLPIKDNGIGKTQLANNDASNISETIGNDNVTASVSPCKCVDECLNPDSCDSEKMFKRSKSDKSSQVKNCKSNTHSLCCEEGNGCDFESIKLKVLSSELGDPVGNDSEKSDIKDEVDCSGKEFSSQFVHTTIDNTKAVISIDPSVFEQGNPYATNMQFKVVNETETEKEKHDTSVKNCSLLVDSVQSQQQLQKSPSYIETIISALEEELKKTGSSDGIHSISITSSEDGGTTVDIQAAPQEVVEQVLPVDGNHDILMVQNVADVINWNPTSGVSVDTSVQAQQAASTVGTASDDNAMVHSSIDTQYDVVEYEVQAEKGKTYRIAGSKKRKRGKDSQKGQPVTVAVMKSKDSLDRTCPMCHRILTYSSSMAAHMRTHTGDRPYSCGQCDRKFTTKANRDRHEATHIGLKPFKCTECEKSFTEKRSLKIHMRVHTGERPFACSICDRAFAQKCTLMVHMDRHNNKKGHLCDLCGKAFRQKSQLDIHVKRHNRQANYPCPECSVKCYTKGDLDRHMIKHTGERPFSCSLCAKTFTRKQYLMDHENTHYGRKPYKCSICDMAFHDLGSCHRHVRKHREQDEVSGNGGNNAKQDTVAILTTDDYDCIVKDSQVGKILTLRDGSHALVTAVDTQADGVTVYHVTRVHDDEEGGNSKETMSIVKEEIVDGQTPMNGDTDSVAVLDFKYDALIS